jgi:short-subunit dehydrogenase
MKEIKTADDLYHLGLHEEGALKVENRPCEIYVMRVASGWIYTETANFTMTFVPFDNNFMPSNLIARKDVII